MAEQCERNAQLRKKLKSSIEGDVEIAIPPKLMECMCCLLPINLSYLYYRRAKCKVHSNEISRLCSEEAARRVLGALPLVSGFTETCEQILDAILEGDRELAPADVQVAHTLASAIDSAREMIEAITLETEDTISKIGPRNVPEKSRGC